MMLVPRVHLSLSIFTFFSLASVFEVVWLWIQVLCNVKRLKISDMIRPFLFCILVGHYGVSTVESWDWDGLGWLFSPVTV